MVIQTKIVVNFLLRCDDGFYQRDCFNNHLSISNWEWEIKQGTQLHLTIFRLNIVLRLIPIQSHKLTSKLFSKFFLKFSTLQNITKKIKSKLRKVW